jgi:hypothetical protein
MPRVSLFLLRFYCHLAYAQMGAGKFQEDIICIFRQKPFLPTEIDTRSCATKQPKITTVIVFVTSLLLIVIFMSFVIVDILLVVSSIQCLMLVA